jgi:hypothetical protein
LTFFVNKYYNIEEEIENLFEFPVFSWKDRDDDDNDDLKPSDGFPPNQIYSYHLLCLQLSQGSIIDYKELYDNTDINDVYLILAGKNAITYIKNKQTDNGK